MNRVHIRKQSLILLLAITVLGSAGCGAAADNRTAAPPAGSVGAANNADGGASGDIQNDPSGGNTAANAGVDDGSAAGGSAVADNDGAASASGSAGGANAAAGGAGAATNDAGQTGSADAQNVRLGTVTAVRAADADSGWAAGDGWIARTDDGGKSWTPQYAGKAGIRQVFALNDKLVWAVQEDGVLLASVDGGWHWEKAGTAPDADFLHFVSATEGFSGSSRTTDGGRTWTKLTAPDGTVGSAYYHDRMRGWAATYNKAKGTVNVERTVDGGISWSVVMSRSSAAGVNGAVVRSAGPDDAWVLLIGESGMTQTSYSLFHTVDGGKSMRKVVANSTAGGGPAPGFPMNYNEGPKNAGASPGPLYVVDTNTAYLGGKCNACDLPNTLGRTTDGGKTWQNLKPQYAGYGDALLAMTDKSHGWWVTSDSENPSVFYTTADGVTWRKTHTFDKPEPQQ